jgi:DNA-binding transcriptional MerR regulator
MSKYDVMKDSLSIQELAEKTGLSRRGVRFYVQRGMLHPPEGKGRGSYYDETHLERLNRIQQLQDGGHSLENIRKILDGELEETEVPPTAKSKGGQRATCWARYPVTVGYELHVNTSSELPTSEQLEAIRKILS